VKFNFVVFEEYQKIKGNINIMVMLIQSECCWVATNNSMHRIQHNKCIYFLQKLVLFFICVHSEIVNIVYIYCTAH